MVCTVILELAHKEVQGQDEIISTDRSSMVCKKFADRMIMCARGFREWMVWGQLGADVGKCMGVENGETGRAFIHYGAEMMRDGSEQK